MVTFSTNLGIQDRRQVPRFEMRDLAIEEGQHGRWILLDQRVCPQGAAQPAHDDRRPQAVAGHVADDHAEVAGSLHNGPEPVTGWSPAHRSRVDAIDV
jgi:hypothetical protein